MNKQSTSTAYTILNNVLKKYHNTRYPLTSLDLFIKELREAGQKAISQDEEFPIGFYCEVSHALIRWCISSFAGLSKADIGPMFQRAWTFHKHVMKMDFSDASTDTLLAEAEKIVKEIERKEEQAIYVAILHHYDDEAKKHSVSEESDAT